MVLTTIDSEESDENAHAMAKAFPILLLDDSGYGPFIYMMT